MLLTKKQTNKLGQKHYLYGGGNKTAFITRRGQFKFTRLPMGASNSPHYLRSKRQNAYRLNVKRELNACVSTLHVKIFTLQNVS